MLPEDFLIGNAQDVLSGFLRRGIRLSIRWRFWGTKRLTRWKHFQESEVIGLDLSLVDGIDQARENAGVPFIITRGLDTPEHNATLPEAVTDSAHLTGHAVDLACQDSLTRFLMVKALLQGGFSRLGIYSAHIHVDNDATKPQRVMWYVAGT